LVALLASLVAASLAVDDLAAMTDAEVMAVLFDASVTAAEARRLWYRPYEIVVRRLAEGEIAPSGARVVEMDRLYLDVPLAGGRIVTRVSDRAAALVDEARRWCGVYVVYWN